jgi:hypothetical protein
MNNVTVISDGHTYQPAGVAEVLILRSGRKECRVWEWADGSYTYVSGDRELAYRIPADRLGPLPLVLRPSRA